MGNNTVHSILKTPTEPDPSEWLTPERRQLIMEQTANIRPLLVQAGLWRATLGYWVRWQASLEANWSKDDEQKSIEQLLEKWQKDHTNDENSGLNTETLKEKLRVTPAVSRWVMINGVIWLIHYLKAKEILIGIMQITSYKK